MPVILFFYCQNQQRPLKGNMPYLLEISFQFAKKQNKHLLSKGMFIFLTKPVL